MATNVYLRSGHATPTTVVLRDPTQGDSGVTHYALDCQPGTTALTGFAATLLRGLVLDAQPGAIAASGADAGLEKTNAYELDCQPAAVALSGADAGLEYSGEQPVVEDKKQTPAGRGSKDRRKRKRYHIDGRVYWAHESELPGLIQAIVTKPVKESPKPVKRAAAALRPKEAITQPAVPVVPVEARLERLEAQFEQYADSALLASLLIARARLIELDEEDIEMLVMA